MNEQVEVMKKIMELTDTMEEGMEHIKEKLTRGHRKKLSRCFWIPRWLSPI